MSPHVSIDRDTVSAFCRRHHITRLALFGSVLRDDVGPDSDVDVCAQDDCLGVLTGDEARIVLKELLSSRPDLIP